MMIPVACRSSAASWSTPRGESRRWGAAWSCTNATSGQIRRARWKDAGAMVRSISWAKYLCHHNLIIIIVCNSNFLASKIGTQKAGWNTSRAHRKRQERQNGKNALMQSNFIMKETYTIWIARIWRVTCHYINLYNGLSSCYSITTIPIVSLPCCIWESIFFLAEPCVLHFFLNISTQAIDNEDNIPNPSETKQLFDPHNRLPWHSLLVSQSPAFSQQGFAVLQKTSSPRVGW